MYIHYPWCRKLCPYCDFAVALGRPGRIPHQAYKTAILDELAERAPAFLGRDLVSVYFGGGTPSLWPADCLAEVIAAVRDRFGDSPRELTIEANPADCTDEVMAGWRHAGINRVSIGVQSFDPDDLETLGRDHAVGDGAAAVTAALAAGFASVSADLIFGTPGANDGHRLEPSVARMATMGSPHLSVYELTIEARTMFGKLARAGRLIPVADARLEAKWLAVHEALTGAGYEHYEISSFARPGHRSVHNTLYWTGGEYLGLGCGAASYRLEAGGSAVRRTNIRSAPKYLRASGEARVEQREQLTPREVADDLIWLGMRTVDGVAEDAFAGREAVRGWLVDSGLAERHAGRIRPTLRGFLCADRVAERLVGA